MNYIYELEMKVRDYECDLHFQFIDIVHLN